MNPLFSRDLLAKCQFKWQNLAGKELLIQVGEVPVEGQPDELGKGMHICVIGIDKTTGISYVLHTGIEE
jgi:hypothetical protein